MTDEEFIRGAFGLVPPYAEAEGQWGLAPIAESPHKASRNLTAFARSNGWGRVGSEFAFEGIAYFEIGYPFGEESCAVRKGKY